jgi:AcrR family transcriptional regulator
MKGKPAQGLRADAERNRKRLLQIAEEVFAAEGLSVPVEEIARRAGVGVGTVYRRFPTKEALVEAILVERIERIATEAERLADTPDAGSTLFALIERLVAEGAAKRDFVDVLGGALGTSAGAATTKRRFRKALRALLSRAQAAGQIRKDVDVADILSFVRGILVDPEIKPGARARRVAVLCDGLRAR